jgi:energy-coupling factor transporter ATP-binding protein EcfA2
MDMSGDLLKNFEKIETLKDGTKFYKADLHFHTPASEDARGSNRYNFNPYKIPYPKRINNPNYHKEVEAVHAGILEQARTMASRIVQRFLEVGLSVVAVTDHNGIGTIWADHESEEALMDLAAPTWYEIIDDAAQNVNEAMGYTELLILPGVEISTTGVHILAVFPPQNPRRKVHFMICDLLNEIGFDVDDWGKNPAVGNASVYDAIDRITQKGGLAIPAHIDGSDQAVLNLYELTSGAMKNFLQNEHLLAVEIVDPDKFSKPDKKTKVPLKAWLDDVRSNKKLPSLAYFQGSDAHDLPTISKRLTYLKMTEPSFSGLQTAIKMPSSRIRIADSFKELNGLYIHGMVLDHPFLGKQTLRFNRNLNCISGKRGAGKTSLFNLMQGVVNPELPKMDGSATLFVEQIAEGVSQYYAYCRNAGQDTVSIFTIDPMTKTVTALDLARAKELSLQPKFYNGERMEQIILDKIQLQAFLGKNFGEPTKANVQKFNDLFSTPRFLDPQKDPLLILSMDKTGYQLAMNMQWRNDKADIKDFFSLSLSQRRTAMMCMIIMSGQFGPVIIDAPEDEFDNEDMAKFLVPVIKEQKDAHQILLFTNHPILAVNTDPDNYLLMQLQGTKLTDIVSGFAIDARAQKPLILNILEGDLETFRKRAIRYE